MAYCIYCRTKNKDDAMFCANCGAPITKAETNTNIYSKETEHAQSQGHWVLDVFLSCIPFIGLLLLIIWSVTDQPDISKQRWARATLLWMIIAVIAGSVIAVLFGALLAGIGAAYM